MTYDVRQWSTTDSSNNSAAPNGWATGTMIPSEVEPTGRMMMGGSARFYTDLFQPVTTGGTSTAYTATITQQPASIAQPLGFAVKWNATCGATPTLNVNSKGAKNLYWPNGTQVTTGDLTINMYSLVFYDGTNYVIYSLDRKDVSGVLTTRGDLLTMNSTPVPTRLAVGTSAQVLKGGTDPSYGSVDGTMIRMGSDAQGDVYYFNGTNVVRLGAGTSGQFLKTAGAGANPAWASALVTGTQAVLNPYSTSGAVTQAHGLGATPKLVDIYLENLTTELGYSVGDQVPLFFNDSGAALGCVTVTKNSTNVILTTRSAGLPIVMNRSTNAAANITAANWKLVATPYYWV